jgi:NAD(P)-dependent dehydrogenase (short-subunit alcohol dehydrogenase family)
MKDFTNKVVVITGAGSGIGRSLALSLAEQGAQLALSDIDTSTLADTAGRCEKIGAKAVPFQLDVAQRSAVYAHAEDVVSEFGGVNLVFNNAGVALWADVADIDWDDFEWLMGINFWGVAHGTKAFLPHLIASGDGHVVNVSSVFGLVGIPSQSAYNAAKFAVRGFTEALRQEVRAARHPVGVTCVHPGGVKTNIAGHAHGLPDGADPESLGRAFHMIALTHPDSAARAILRGVKKNKPRVLIGLDAHVLDAVPRVIGPRYEDILASFYRAGRYGAGRRIAERLGIPTRLGF